MTDNEINSYAWAVREAVGWPVSPTVMVDGPPLTNAQRVIGALVRRLGGDVVLSKEELDQINGMVLTVENDAVSIEVQ